MAIGDWIAAGGGNWADAFNWDFGNVPDGVGGFANFFTSNAAGGGGTGFRDIDLQGLTRTVGFLNFESDDDTWYRPTNGTINFQVSGGSAFIFDNSDPAIGPLGGTEIAADVTMSSNATFSIANAATTLEISGDVTGAGDITKIGDGRLLLTGTGNTAEIASISAGTLAIGGNGASIGGNNNGDTITVNAGGTLELTPFLTDFTLDADIVGAGDVLINAINATVTVADGDLEHTGATRITNGTLELNFDFRLNDTSGIEVTGLGVLDLNDTFQQGIKGVSGNGIIRAAAVQTFASADRFWLDITADQTFDGTFQGNMEVKVESGFGGTRSLTLTGNSTHTGPTTAEGAEIILSGSTVGLTNSTVVLDNGALDALGVTGVDSAKINDLQTIGGTLNDLFIGGSGLHITEADDFLSITATTLNIFGDNGNENRLRVDMDSAATNADLSGILFVNWDSADTIEIIGTTGANVITGTTENDFIDGDINNAGNADDTLNGGNGDDTLRGGGGNDTIDGGAGFDFADYSSPGVSGSASTIIFVDLTVAGPQNTGTINDTDTLSNIEGLIGSQFRDLFTGDGNDNHFIGASNDDEFDGGGGADLLDGGADDDTLNGDGGDDILIGGTGADALDGGIGFDTASYRNATSGINAFLLAPGANSGEAAGDTYTSIEGLEGSAFNDSLFGTGGDNRLDGGDGNDQLNGGGGADELIGGAGIDRAVYTVASGVATTVDLQTSGANTGTAAGDTFDSIENLFGGQGDETLRGDALDNLLQGEGGDDILDGRAGIDTLLGGSDNDTLIGGGGGDILNGSSGVDTASYRTSTAGLNAFLAAPANNLGDASLDTYVSIENLEGTDFADGLFGDSAANEIRGRAGGDLLNGGGAADTLFGEDGDDFLQWNIGDGNDVMNGGNDFDTLDLDGFDGDVVVDLSTGNATIGAESLTLSQIENVVAGDGDDEITGDVFVNELSGGNDNDILDGGANADTLNGGAGDDILIGGTGALFSSAGDALDGGSGTDTASYETASVGVRAALDAPGINTNDAAGDSYSSIENLTGSDFVDDLRGDAGNNTLAGGDGNDFLTGRDGIDTLQGGNGDDVLNGGDGFDNLDGGAGIDRIVYNSSSVGVIVNLDGSGPLGDVIINVEDLRGSNHDDSLGGDAGANRIEGLNGSDDIQGRAGDDTLLGGGGDDILSGGLGTDALFGAGGTDMAAYGNASVTADLQNSAFNVGAEAVGDTYSQIEDLAGNDQNDSLRGNGNDNALFGGGGNDFLVGRNGDDVLNGGDGDDVLDGGNGGDVYNGGAGIDQANYIGAVSGVRVDFLFSNLNTGVAVGDTHNDVENMRGSRAADDLRGDNDVNKIEGFEGNDIIFGRNGNDELRGGSGDDVLGGGAGDDFLAGSTGNDIFYFNAATDGNDTIQDFQINRDVFRLNDTGFSALAPGALSASNFVVGSAAADVDDFIIYDSAIGALFYDADGNGGGAAIQFATLANTAAIDENDFVIV